MKPIVDQLNSLKVAMDTEETLRRAATTEFNSGEHNGVMKAAHDKSILAVIEAAKKLIEKSEEK